MESKNEIKKFINSYILNQIRTHKTLEFYSLSHERSTHKNLIDVLLKSNDFEKPDGYFFDLDSSTLFLFEHFEFDCSKNNRHGSTLRRNSATVNQKINKEIISTSGDYSSVKTIEQGIGVKSGNNITYYMGDNGDIYRNNYIENIRKLYESHSQNLQNYIRNCEQEINFIPQNIVISFLIEDVTMGGTYYKCNNGIGEPVNLILTQQFLEIFKKSNVNYVLFGMRNNQTLTICDRTIVNDDFSIYNDLLKEELFIFPAMQKITFGKKIT